MSSLASPWKLKFRALAQIIFQLLKYLLIDFIMIAGIKRDSSGHISGITPNRKSFVCFSDLEGNAYNRLRKCALLDLQRYSDIELDCAHCAFKVCKVNLFLAAVFPELNVIDSFS